MRFTAALVFAVLTAAAVAPAQTQSGTARSGGYTPPNDFEFACPMRAVTAVLKTISPEGHLTFESKGRLMVAKATDETLFRIPGYSKQELKEGALVKLQPNARAKMRICERNGLVYEMKVLDQPRRGDKKR